jgi:hypothetical protein
LDFLLFTLYDAEMFKKLIIPALLLLSFSPASAAAETPLFSVPSDTVIWGPTGSEHQLGTWPVSPELIGQTCPVILALSNNESRNPNNDLIVESGTTLYVFDVERLPGPELYLDEMTFGPTISASIKIGWHTVYSGGLTLTAECPIAPTTTVVQTTLPPTTLPETTLPETTGLPTTFPELSSTIPPETSGATSVPLTIDTSTTGLPVVMTVMHTEASPPSTISALLPATGFEMGALFIGTGVFILGVLAVLFARRSSI